jgi:hypothetical protein
MFQGTAPEFTCKVREGTLQSSHCSRLDWIPPAHVTSASSELMKLAGLARFIPGQFPHYVELSISKAIPVTGRGGL